MHRDDVLESCIRELHARFRLTRISIFIVMILIPFLITRSMFSLLIIAPLAWIFSYRRSMCKSILSRLFEERLNAAVKCYITAIDDGSERTANVYKLSDVRNLIIEHICI